MISAICARFASGLFWMIFVSIAVAGCSNEASQKAIDIDVLTSEDQPQVIDPSATIEFSLQEYDGPVVLEKYIVPLETIKINTLEQKADLADGMFLSAALNLRFVLVDGELLRPSEAYGKYAQSMVFVDFRSVRVGYEDRLRSRWDSNYEFFVSSIRRRTGEFEFGAERIELKGAHGDSSDVWLSEDPDLGFVLIECRGKLRSDGSYDKPNGRCTVTYPMGSNMSLSATFHQSLRSDWKAILVKVKNRILSWEKH